MTNELKPCPFCGGSNLRVDVGLMEFVDGEVSCECGGSVGNHPTKEKAIDSWNRRSLVAAAEPFPQPDRNRAGKEPCGECHIKTGETCDICGASNPIAPAPVVTDDWIRDTSMNVMLATEVEEATRILEAALAIREGR